MTVDDSPASAAIPSGLVRAEGLEPPRLATREPKSRASTNSATPAEGTLGANGSGRAARLISRANSRAHAKNGRRLRTLPRPRRHGWTLQPAHSPVDRPGDGGRPPAAPPGDPPKSAPGPASLPASPCSQTAAQAASNAGICCARSPAQKPASTSPDPAVASQAEALSAIAARPSGAATTVSPPFSSTTAPVAAARGARPRELRRRLNRLGFNSLNRRLNSPSCGVSSTGACRPLIAAVRAGELACETRERIGIEHHGRSRRQRRQHQLAHPRPDPTAGPEHGDVAPADPPGNPRMHPASSTGRTITARLAAALTASASRGDAIVTRPAPARSAPRAAKPRRPGRIDAARQHDRMAARVFVTVESRHAETVRARAPAHCGMSSAGCDRARSPEFRCRRRRCARNAAVPAAADGRASCERT